MKDSEFLLNYMKFNAQYESIVNNSINELKNLYKDAEILNNTTNKHFFTIKEVFIEELSQKINLLSNKETEFMRRMRFLIYDLSPKQFEYFFLIGIKGLSIIELEKQGYNRNTINSTIKSIQDKFLLDEINHEKNTCLAKNTIFKNITKTRLSPYEEIRELCKDMPINSGVEWQIIKLWYTLQDSKKNKKLFPLLKKITESGYDINLLPEYLKKYLQAKEKRKKKI